MKIRESFFFLKDVVLCVLFFFFSYIFSNYFTLGDQYYYSRFYSSLEGVGFINAVLLYREMLSAIEPAYFIIVYSFSDVLSKNVLFSIINALLLYLLLCWVRSRKVSVLIYPIIFLNFYLFVLLFSAERLKIAFLFLLLSFVLSKRLRFLFQSLSVFAHVQIILLIFSARVVLIRKLFVDLFVRFKINLAHLSILLFFLLALVVVVFFAWDYLLAKFIYYSAGTNGIVQIVKPLIFLFLALTYAGKGERVDVILAILPITFLSYFIGSERLVIFTYVIFMYYALQYNRGFNMGVLITGLYFIYQGIVFLSGIILHGDGFYCLMNKC